ncbi:MAG: hypothetical protein KGZ85_07935 [Ignavibacterium sp.]|nr:hypothetical protein [Ignavibacterium sp.]
MTKFNFTQGCKTKKGPVPVTRLITKDHSVYPIFFDEFGLKRTKEEVERILKELEAKEKDDQSLFNPKKV